VHLPPDEILRELPGANAEDYSEGDPWTVGGADIVDGCDTGAGVSAVGDYIAAWKYFVGSCAEIIEFFPCAPAMKVGTTWLLDAVGWRG
jgi:hypothetical protein